jgi:catechol 2,3-dioxygenase-like lactoylglutathione lyase family enzyme
MNRLHQCALVAGLISICHVVAANDGMGRRSARVIGIDHVPVAVNDLEAASERYRALGFALKEGRPHPNGIRNRHAKFPDGTEIELITASKATDALTRRYVAHLRNGDGPAFLALFVPPETDLLKPLSEAGFRAAESGGLVTLSRDSRLPYIFFGPRQRSPTDRPEHFQHPNSAVSLARVWIAGNNLSAELNLFKLLGARITSARVSVPEPTPATVAEFAEGSVLLLPARSQSVPKRRIVGLTVIVRDVQQAARAVGSSGRFVPSRTPGCERLVVRPQEANGVWLEFAEECATGSSRPRSDDAVRAFTSRDEFADAVRVQPDRRRTRARLLR